MLTAPAVENPLICSSICALLILMLGIAARGVGGVGTVDQY